DRRPATVRTGVFAEIFLSSGTVDPTAAVICSRSSPVKRIPYNEIGLFMRLKRIYAAVFQRPRLLWLVMGGMLLLSVVPLFLYHRQVLQLSQEKLTDTESVQQSEVTRSVGDEIQLFDSNLYQQLISARQILALTGLLDKVNDPVRAPQVTRLLE